MNESGPVLRPFVAPAAIESERLVLRPFEGQDLASFARIQADPEVCRYLYWPPRDLEQSRAALSRKMGARAISAEGGSLALAVVSRSTGELVADLSLWLASEADAQGEIGFVVAPEHQGRGYATEAARLVLAIAFDGVGMHRVVGRLEVRNAASARVLEKIGMRREAELLENEWVKGEWQSEAVYAVLSREWRAARTRLGADSCP